jgi:hypothetical protein
VSRPDEDEELVEKALTADLAGWQLATVEDIVKKTVDRGYPMSPAQRSMIEAWVRGERYRADEKYENLVSSGRAPRGRPVELLVKDKPLRPPGR